MVGMDVSIEHITYAPSVLARQPQVHYRFEGGVDNHRLGSRTHHIGEASFPRAAHLHHSGIAEHQFRGVPCETPCLHAACEGKRINPALPELLSGHPTDLASIA